MNFHFDRIVDHIPFMLKGIFVTLEYTVLALSIGLVLGTFLALMKLSKSGLWRAFATFYISIFRGTPLLVQLSLIYFATPQLIGYQITALEAGLLAFSLNSTAYVSEIIRAGIEAVDKGQFEAAESLAIPYHKAMLCIIMPQAIRNILPALVNEAINLLKESALVSVIGEMDLLRRANIVSSQTFLYFEPLLFIAVVYYLLVSVLSQLSKILEKRLKRSD
jgi:His/Glu/Gln/Arg/opine family amino acid ABC transporter permease subunit